MHVAVHLREERQQEQPSQNPRAVIKGVQRQLNNAVTTYALSRLRKGKIGEKHEEIRQLYFSCRVATACRPRLTQQPQHEYEVPMAPIGSTPTNSAGKCPCARPSMLQLFR